MERQSGKLMLAAAVDDIMINSWNCHRITKCWEITVCTDQAEHVENDSYNKMKNNKAFCVCQFSW